MLQNPCIPPSGIEEGKAKKRIALFLNNKLPTLSDWINDYEGNPTPAKKEAPGFRYTKKQFLNLISILKQPGNSGLRVYLGSYLEDRPYTDPYIKRNYENLMALIFAPTKTKNGGNDCDSKEKDTGPWYLLRPDLDTPTHAADEDLIELTGSKQLGMAINWIGHYQDNKIYKLLHDAPMPPVKETKSIWFDIDCIYDWEQAINNTYPGGKTISTVLIAFAAYFDGDQQIPPATTGNPRKVDRQFSLILSIKPDDALEDPPYFYNIELLITKEKLNEIREQSHNKRLLSAGYYDTGKPCPPPSTGCS